MPSPDVVRLRHMHEAITLALEMTSGRNRQDLASNSMLAMALTRCLEVLGEAASKLSDEVRLRFPGVPFVKMISMRNRLIHAYFDVDLDMGYRHGSFSMADSPCGCTLPSCDQ